MSAVKSRLGPHHDVRHTIEACRRAESVDNNDNLSRHNDDRGRRRRQDSDDDRERNWSPNQRSPRLLAGASEMRSSPRASGLRPTYRDTTWTPTPVCGLRITGLRATSAGRPTTSS
jgi:hypothetical protein